MVSNRPQVIPLPMRASPEKFQKYKDLKETATSERDRPSYKPATDASRAAKQKDKKTQQETGITYHAKSARATIKCSECDKLREVFSKERLTRNQQRILDVVIEERIYVCGEELISAGEPLYEITCVRRALVCGMPIEKAYFSSRKFALVCTWCATGGMTIKQKHLIS